MKTFLALLALVALTLPTSACPPAIVGAPTYGSSSSFQIVVPTVSTVVVPGCALAPAGYVQAPLVAAPVGYGVGYSAGFAGYSAGFASPAFVGGYGAGFSSFGFHRQRVFLDRGFGFRGGFRGRAFIVR